MIKTINFQRIGYLRNDLPHLQNWCREQTPTMTPSLSNYVVGDRLEKWFEKRWSLSKEVKVFEAPHDQRLYRLGQRLYPDNHACLFLYYPPGS
jgi:hypothetical protein